MGSWVSKITIPLSFFNLSMLSWLLASGVCYDVNQWCTLVVGVGGLFPVTGTDGPHSVVGVIFFQCYG